METNTGVFDVLYSARSMRRLHPDPVPEEILVKLVDAGIRGPSAANAQNWHFVIVQDRKVIRRMAEPWRKGIGFFVDNAFRAPAKPGEDFDQRRRTLRSVMHLADHFEELPAAICVCVERDRYAEQLARRPSVAFSAIRHFGLLGTFKMGLRAKRRREQELWATAYTATENVLLAARALGLGAVMTVPMVLAPPGTYERILGLPRNVLLAAVIPVGFPLGKFGAVSRPSVESVISWDRHGGRRS
ncbi:MAG: nitroreductase family protein [Acidimicrobiia bacterium]|nr:nitroreductase family protein [Acidimicrobiia bacterium]MDH3398446.1 nitroreductase family protein [Acidimicrobiia bacterium]